KRLPAATIPDDHLARAVLPGGNRSLEGVVIHRMVFDMHRHAFDRWIQAWALRYCPAFHRAVNFEPEVIVQSARPVLLYDKLRLAGRSSLCLPRTLSPC